MVNLIGRELSGNQSLPCIEILDADTNLPVTEIELDGATLYRPEGVVLTWAQVTKLSIPVEGFVQATYTL